MSDRTAGTALCNFALSQAPTEARHSAHYSVLSHANSSALWSGWSVWEWQVSQMERLAPAAASSRQLSPSLYNNISHCSSGLCIRPSAGTAASEHAVSAEWRSALTTLPLRPSLRSASPNWMAFPLSRRRWNCLSSRTPRRIPTPRAIDAQQSPKLAEKPRIADAAVPRRPARIAAATQVAPEDNRSFLEKIFGQQQPATPALAYAAPQDNIIDNARGQRLSPTPRLENPRVGSRLQRHLFANRLHAERREALKHILDLATDWTAPALRPRTHAWSNAAARL